MSGNTFTDFTVYCNRDDLVIKELSLRPMDDGSLEWMTPVAGLRVGDRRVLESDDYLRDASSEHARWRREFRCAACGGLRCGAGRELSPDS